VTAERERIGVAVLGSTGSIGTQTLDVLRAFPDRFRLVTLAGGSNAQLLEEQAHEFRPALISHNSAGGIDVPAGVQVATGSTGLVECATHSDVEIVVVATAGVASVEAVIAAITAGKIIALANKEALVCAAEVIKPLLVKHETDLRPVDSEHSAIWQCSGTLRRDDLIRLTLTASGGPFRTWSPERLRSATPADALRHPNWSMGNKITIDSATLVNKGLEIIEAHHLFGLEFDAIDAVIHPQSLVHSLAEFADGSTLAQISYPDMRLPIQYALTAPEHASRDVALMDLIGVGSFTFEAVDSERFPGLRLCREAGSRGGSASAVLCAADEVAVEAFLDERIGFMDITSVIAETLDQHIDTRLSSLDDVLAVTEWADHTAREVAARRTRR
jgi:1-deoxy-D-xylulose-5-phosphate reductoisomerase